MFDFIKCKICVESIQVQGLESGTDYICPECFMELYNSPFLFRCNICLTDDCEIDTLEIVETSNCTHLFCRPCLGRYVDIALQTTITPSSL